MADDFFAGGGEHHETHKYRSESFLTQKVGGIPVVGIGAGLGILIVLLVILRKRRKSAATSSPVSTSLATTNPNLAFDDPNQTDPSTGETFSQEGYTTTSAVDSYLAGATSGAYSPTGISPNGTQTSSGIPAPVTNEQWGSLAADTLIAQGNDPSLVSNAINDFLQGNPLTTAEQAVINLALRMHGEPPEGVTAITAAPSGGAEPPVGTPPGPSPAANPVTPGMSLSAALGAAQNAGLSVSQVYVSGITGIKNMRVIDPTQYAAYGANPVEGAHLSGNSLVISLPPSTAVA